MYNLTIQLTDNNYVIATGFNSVYAKEQEKLINFINSCLVELSQIKLFKVKTLKTNLNNYIIQVNTFEDNVFPLLYSLLGKINQKYVIPFKVYTKKIK